MIDLDPLAVRQEAVGPPATTLQPWFLRFQRDVMALTLSGDEAPFEAVARESLRTETKLTLSERDIEYVVEGFATLPTFDDAAPALKQISEAGASVGCLTVNSPEKLAISSKGRTLPGLLTMWLPRWFSRLEYEPGDVFLPADVTGDSLVEVADKLMSLH